MTLSQPPRRWLIIAAFAAIYLIWGSSYIAIRFAVETLPPFLMSGTRFVGAGLLLIGIARLSGAPLPRRVEWRSSAIAALLMFALNNGSLVWSQAHGLPSSVVALLLATTPFWIVIVGWIQTRRSPGWAVLAGVVIGFGGLALLINPGASGTTIDPLLAGLVVGGALFWALGSLYAKGAPTPANPQMATGTQLLLGGVMLLIVSLVSGEFAAADWSSVRAGSVAAMIYLGLFNSCLGFSAFVWLMRVVPPARVATYAYVNPVIALFLGWLLAGETLDARSLLAAAIILGSVVMITRARDGSGSRRTAPAHAPVDPARTAAELPAIAPSSAGR
ncbi:MAG: EamA family transporter [Candidatus Flexifilum sp.]|jgi:drug/metabolite transporter (DMT)-like permease